MGMDEEAGRSPPPSPPSPAPMHGWSAGASRPAPLAVQTTDGSGAVEKRWLGSNPNAISSPNVCLQTTDQGTRPVKRDPPPRKQPSRSNRRASLKERAATQRVKMQLAKGAQELLDQNHMWTLKTHYVFPVIAQLRFLDHYSRVLFPFAYFSFILAHFSEINFGADNSVPLFSAGHCGE